MAAIEIIMSKYGIRDYEDIISCDSDDTKDITSLEIFDGDHSEFPAHIDLQEFVSNFKNLKRLNIDVYGQEITDLSLLEDLVGLESIYIECNTSINNLDFLNNLVHLESLHIVGSEVSDISCLSKNKKLNFIGLENSKIEDISVLTELPLIESVKFTQNRIKEINALKHHKGLKNLFISNNAIDTIEALNDFEALKHIDISHNNISDLTPISRSKGLNSLKIANNKIRDVQFLNECHHLNNLDISNNLIESIDFLKEMQQLNYVNISNNPIASIDPLKELQSMSHLNASSLNGVEIDSSFSFQSTMFHLEMSNCNLSNASFLSNQYKLVRLNLSNNRLSNFHFLKGNTFIKQLNLKNNHISDVFPAYYFFDIDAIDLRENEFGGKIFERYPGSGMSAYSNFDTPDYKEPSETGSTIELGQLIADHYYKKGDNDAALAYHYLQYSSRSETAFNIYLNKFLEMPDSEVVYLKYYFSVILRNIPGVSEDKKPIHPNTIKKYADFLKKLDITPFRNHFLAEELKKINGIPNHQLFFKFQNDEFYFYEKKVNNPLIQDELFFIKAHSYRYLDQLKREDLHAAIFCLKELYTRSSPYFYKLRNEILTTLKMHFASTDSERKLHDYFRDGVVNINEREFEEPQPLLDAVERGISVKKGYFYVHSNQELIESINKPKIKREVNRIVHPNSPITIRTVLLMIGWILFILLMLGKIIRVFD
jgi:hypothetical protein